MVQKTFAYTPANLLESATHAGVQDPSEMTWDADSDTNSKHEYRNSKEAQLTEKAKSKRSSGRLEHFPLEFAFCFVLRISNFGFVPPTITSMPWGALGCSRMSPGT